MPDPIVTSTVLCALDFEGEWPNTLEHAASIARWLGARLHLVAVVEPPHWLMRAVMDSAALDQTLEEHRAHAQRSFADAASRVPDLAVTTELRTGVPSEEILAARAGVDAGVIACGMGKQRDPAHLLLGGTADRLLHSSPVPVYVAALKAASDPRVVLVPTGLGPSGGRAIEVAAALVAPFGGEVIALYMVSLPSLMSSYKGDVLKLRAEIESRARVEFDAHIARLTLPEGGRPIRQVLKTDLEIVGADETILREARAQHADFICFALGGRKLLDALVLGRVSTKVVRALPCPLLALPDAWVGKRAAPFANPK